MEGFRPVVSEHDDPEGGDGGKEGGADGGLTQGDGGHEVHGELLTLSSEAKIWSELNIIKYCWSCPSHCSSALIKVKKVFPCQDITRFLSHEFPTMIFQMFTNYHNCDFMQGKLHSPGPRAEQWSVGLSHRPWARDLHWRCFARQGGFKNLLLKRKLVE